MKTKVLIKLKYRNNNENYLSGQSLVDVAYNRKKKQDQIS
jgi:hypothetical protein